MKQKRTTLFLNLLFLLTIIIFLLPGSVRAAWGPDSFNPNATSLVSLIALQSDGKVLINSGIVGWNRVGIVRLNADGSLDDPFDPDTCEFLALQPNGKILVTRSLASKQYLARLNSDGTLDTTFNNSLQGAVYSYSIAIQSDGKILISDANAQYLTRLNSDGTLDTTFNTSMQGGVGSIAIQSDGKILIGGNFTTINSVPKQYIARLNSDGSLDTTFNAYIDYYGISECIVQSDGKILIGGNFLHVNGERRNYIARLNSDGSLDAAFNPEFYWVNGTDLNSIAIQPDGKILVGGEFTHVNGMERKSIARLNSDGSLDTAFNPDVRGEGDTENEIIDNTNIYAFATQPDGKILIGGYFNNVGGVVRNHIARLTDDYTSDAIPSQFVFVDLTDVTLNTTINSSSITVSGINTAATISITGGTYSINGGAFTSANGTVNNNDTIRVQLTSSGSYLTKTNATLTIGGVSDIFSVTTQASSNNDNDNNGAIDDADNNDDDDSGGGGGSDWCFIATAAFGSPMAEQVEILRQFRDKYLRTNYFGRKFVSWYYRNGPIAANFIKDKPFVKAVVRVALYPLIGFSFLLIYGYLPLVVIGFLLATLFFLRFKPKKLNTI